VPWRCLALGLVGLATTATSLVAGFSLHHDDIPVWLFWLRYKRFGSLSLSLSPSPLSLSFSVLHTMTKSPFVCSVEGA
jgi:hypothetical protein